MPTKNFFFLNIPNYSSRNIFDFSLSWESVESDYDRTAVSGGKEMGSNMIERQLMLPFLVMKKIIV